jgi:replicative DNA helicase
LELKDKVPPHNKDAEKATLGALLQDAEAMDIVLRYIRPKDFFSSRNSTIFEAMLSLYQKGESYDLITLSENLNSQGKLDAAGGTSYIASLSEAVPTSANIEYYSKLVQETSIKRSMIKISSEIISDAYQPTSQSRELLEEAEKKIFQLTDDRQIGAYKSAKEIIPEAFDHIQKMYKTKNAFTGVPTGYSELDNFTGGFQKSQLIILAARPSIGKTTFALNLAAHMAFSENIPVGFFSLEMPYLSVFERLIASETRIDFQKVRSGHLRRSEITDLAHAGDRINDAPFYIDDSPDMKLLDLRAQARRMKAKEDIQIIFIDYLTLIHAEDKSIARHEQVAEISRSLKGLARELKIPVVALSQVSRDTEGKRPQLSNLRESGSLEQDADVVMFIHRERGLEKTMEEDHGEGVPTELILAKQRNGPTGTIPLLFFKQFTRFEAPVQGDFA